MSSQQFNCDHLRCKKPATWHGFDGRSHFCEVHKPDAPSERVSGLGAWKSDDELLGLTFRGRKKRR